MAELAAGRTLEHELEGLAVEGRPLGDDVGDEPAVVLRGRVHVVAGGGADVDAVGPHVAGEADVEEVLQRCPTDGRSEGDWHVTHRRRRPPAALHRLGPDGGELCHELLVRQVGAFTDLQLVHAVDPVVRVDLLVERHTPPELMQELGERRLRVA